MAEGGQGESRGTGRGPRPWRRRSAGGEQGQPVRTEDLTVAQSIYVKNVCSHIQYHNLLPSPSTFERARTAGCARDSRVREIRCNLLRAVITRGPNPLSWSIAERERGE